MPQAAFVAGAVAACFRRESREPRRFSSARSRRSRPRAPSSRSSRRGRSLVWTSGGSGAFRARVKAHAAGIAIVAAFLVSRVAFCAGSTSTIRPTVRSTGPILARAAERFWPTSVGSVLRLAARSHGLWGFFWPAARSRASSFWLARRQNGTRLAARSVRGGRRLHGDLSCSRTGTSSSTRGRPTHRLLSQTRARGRRGGRVIVLARAPELRCPEPGTMRPRRRASPSCEGAACPTLIPAYAERFQREGKKWGDHLAVEAGQEM